MLILNAGVLRTDLQLTEDHLEEMFQVNYVSQAYLTVKLIQTMLSSQNNDRVRVVAVSCESHRVE